MKNANKELAMPTQLSFDFNSEILEGESREVLNWLIEQRTAGAYHSRKTVKDAAREAFNLSHERVSECMSYLLKTGQLQENKRLFDGKRGKGGAYNYLNPTGFMVRANK
jgi:hypothetical protein